MINVGLSPERTQRLLSTLTRTHYERVVVQLMDLQERVIMSVSDRLLAGQVNITSNNDVTRTASLTLFNADSAVPIGNRDFVSGTNYFDKIIAVYVSVWEEGDLDSVDIPLFRGPVTGFRRRGIEAQIECQGKEILARNAFWRPKTYTKGTNKTSVVESIFRDYIGEAKLGLNGTSAKLPSNLVFPREAITFTEASAVADSMGMYLFYDGRGVPQMRPYPSAISYVFRTGNGGSVLEEPEVSASSQSALVNTVIFKGYKFETIAYAPNDHPLNHNRFGRNDVPAYHPTVIEDTEEKSRAAGAARAKSSLAAYLTQENEVKFNASPIYLLEEGDLFGLDVRGDFYLESRLRDVSWPLAGAQSSVGSVKNLQLKVA